MILLEMENSNIYIDRLTQYRKLLSHIQPEFTTDTHSQKPTA